MNRDTKEISDSFEKKRPPRPDIFRVVLVCAFVVFFHLVSSSLANAKEQLRVTLVIDRDHPVYDELIQETRRHLASREAGGPVISVVALSETPASRVLESATTADDLIVTVGAAAMVELSKLNPRIPVLSVLVPKISVEELMRKRGAAIEHGAFSAIYLDQPLGRRLDLVRLIIPKARRVGVVVGPGNEDLEHALATASQQRKFHTEIRRVAADDNVIAALDEVLKRSDVLLGVVDSYVFNRANAHNLLVTAYRHRVPLIGVSPAYVKAGALAAVHSTPAQIGRQLAESLVSLAGERPKLVLPDPQYPKYFSVAVNPHVARSLDLVVDDEERLADKLFKLSGSLRE